MAFQITSPYEQDAYLVEEFQQGNDEAFTGLMKVHLPWVYGLCRRVSSEEAEDLCQEIFIQVYQNITKLRHPQAFNAWLRKIAWHHCQKKSMRDRRFDVLDETVIVSDPWSSVIDGDELGWAFDQLPINQRQVVVLSLIYGFQVSDISSILGIPCGTVKSRLHNARKVLQNLLTRAEGDIDMNTRDRIIQEVQGRILQFHNQIIRPSYEDQHQIELLEENARKWHQLRQEDAENNAKLYGISLAETGPRMTREKIMSGTLSRAGITRAVMGVPETTEYMDFRDASRRLLVSPFTLLRWVKQGMPTVRYYPWMWLDLDLVAKWLAENNIDPPKEVSIQEMDVMERYILIEVQAGRASVDDALELLESM